MNGPMERREEMQRRRKDTIWERKREKECRKETRNEEQEAERMEQKRKKNLEGGEKTQLGKEREREGEP